MNQTLILTLIFVAMLPWGELDNRNYVVRRNAAEQIKREATVSQIEEKLADATVSVEAKHTLRGILPTVKKREYKIHVADRTISRNIMIRGESHYIFASNANAPDSVRYQKMLSAGVSPEEVLTLASALGNSTITIRKQEYSSQLS